MAETQDTGARPAKNAPEDVTYRSVLKSLVGQVVTVVNPESYEHAPVGHQIKTGFYRAKVTGVGQDCVVLVTEFDKKGKDAGKERVRQYIPVERVKRVSVMSSEKLIHI